MNISFCLFVFPREGFSVHKLIFLLCARWQNIFSVELEGSRKGMASALTVSGGGGGGITISNENYKAFGWRKIWEEQPQQGKRFVFKGVFLMRHTERIYFLMGVFAASPCRFRVTWRTARSARKLPPPEAAVDWPVAGGAARWYF